jgi:hypothetical protein
MKKPKPQELEAVVRLDPGERGSTGLRQFALDAAVRTSVPGLEPGEVLAAAVAFLGFLEDRP